MRYVIRNLTLSQWTLLSTERAAIKSSLAAESLALPKAKKTRKKKRGRRMQSRVT